MIMSPETFGVLPGGVPVSRWTLERAGVRVAVLTYGGIVQSVRVRGGDGRPVQVALGFPGLDGYLAHPEPYLGALVGRYANRIAGARVEIDGRTHVLPANEGTNLLHGGPRGFDKRVWDAEPVAHGVRLSRVSPDGEEGFPGRLRIAATYTLDPDGALRIGYEATTDAPTVVNVTNHTYWNLAGAGSGSAVGHELRLAAGRLTETGPGNIPTGRIVPVEGTRFDFREPRGTGPGYDHNYVLDKGVTERPEPVALLSDAASGRTLSVATTEPGLQLYTGDHLSHGPYGPCAGIALETQHFPDSPRHPHFPGTVLRPGEVFRSQTVYGFSAR
ncbi:aldose epimerase family protein [Streptomyces sp. NPDC050560]|uniref:aldose epimerase family protein n=1 Tax=Streptomyces sp. NPDC050560 TaxID=3365630 RepID=UPI00379CA9E0